MVSVREIFCDIYTIWRESYYVGVTGVARGRVRETNFKRELKQTQRRRKRERHLKM